MSKVLVIAVSTFCALLLAISFNKKTEVVNTKSTSNPKIHGIKISEYLSPLMTSNEQIRYKYLFRTSIDGNLNSLRELIAFSCGGGSRCYGHGSLIFKIVEHIGEEKFIKIIPSMSKEELLWLKALLDFGLEYADFEEKHDSITLKDKFPKISETLDYYTNDPLCFTIRRFNIPLCKDS